MWLPKDERKLLTYYYSQGRADHICQRDPSALIKQLRERNNQTEKQVDETYVMNVLRALQKHGLIQDVRKVHGTGQIEVKLTQAALNLGKKYKSKLGTFEVWCSEHKVVLGLTIALLGVIITLIWFLATIFRN